MGLSFYNEVSMVETVGSLRFASELSFGNEGWRREDRLVGVKVD